MSEEKKEVVDEISKMSLREIAEFTHKGFPNSYFVGNYTFDQLSQFDDTEVWFYEDILGCYENETGGLNLCSCGCFENVRGFIVTILKCQSLEEFDDRQMVLKKIFNLDEVDELPNIYDGVYQFTLHVLEDAGFVEHGSSVYGSHLTKRAKVYLEILKRMEL